MNFTCSLAIGIEIDNLEQPVYTNVVDDMSVRGNFLDSKQAKLTISRMSYRRYFSNSSNRNAKRNTRWLYLETDGRRDGGVEL